MTSRLVAAISCIGLVWTPAARAADKAPTKEEVKKLEKRVEQQDDVIRNLENRINEMEESSPQAPPPVAEPPAAKKDAETAWSAEEIEGRMFPEGHQSPVENRATYDDHQESAARPEDYVLDPQY